MRMHRVFAVVTTAARWHVTSQEQARRNALVAGTALAARRREREEVDALLELHRRRHEARRENARRDRPA